MELVEGIGLAAAWKAVAAANPIQRRRHFAELVVAIVPLEPNQVTDGPRGRRL
jgi:hypothetical protein